MLYHLAMRQVFFLYIKHPKYVKPVVCLSVIRQDYSLLKLSLISLMLDGPRFLGLIWRTNFCLIISEIR